MSWHLNVIELVVFLIALNALELFMSQKQFKRLCDAISDYLDDETVSREARRSAYLAFRMLTTYWGFLLFPSIGVYAFYLIAIKRMPPKVPDSKDINGKYDVFCDALWDYFFMRWRFGSPLAFGLAMALFGTLYMAWAAGTLLVSSLFPSMRHALWQTFARIGELFKTKGGLLLQS